MIKDWNLDASWTLFLDRDGVINERIFGAYILRKSDFKFKEGVLEVSSELFGRFSKVFVVTNQQCIGKGLVPSNTIDLIHLWMCEQFQNCGATVDQVFVAPELNDENTTHRKPSVKMGLMAKEDYPDVDFSKSIMVGDTDSDIEFGKRLGMKTVLVTSDESCSAIPDLYVSSLLELNALLL